MASMKLPAAVRDEIVAHSRADDPNECCGIIAGRDGDATRSVRIRNAAASPLRFEMDTMEQYRAISAIEDAGEELVAHYHSHTRSEAYPSQTDINLARWWPGVRWLICSLADEQPVVRGFEIADGRVEEIELEVG